MQCYQRNAGGDSLRTTTRWDPTWKLDTVSGTWAAKARFVAREYRTQEWWLDDLFAASSHPLLSRVVDHLSLKLNLSRFTIDATNAF